jgi:hypothetical protein
MKEFWKGVREAALCSYQRLRWLPLLIIAAMATSLAWEVARGRMTVHQAIPGITHLVACAWGFLAGGLVRRK